MEKSQPIFAPTFSLIAILGLVSFILCIGAEFKRTKTKDLKVDGKLCYLPGSRAFGLGIAALTCLFVAQIIGNLLVYMNFCLGEKGTNSKPRKRLIAKFLMLLSWISFGIAVVLISAATSMNTKQNYGKGWLNGECYIVTNGVYIGSAMLVMVIVSSILVSAVLTMRASHVDQGRKVHAQVSLKKSRT